MEAKLVRKSLLNHIEVTLPNKEVCELWEGIVEHCAKQLSTNELKTVYAQCSKQLSAINPDDVPLVFKKMMAELQQVIINRKAY
jgi:predicted ribosome-associated RNA-binding protein Tma20